jgi:hypothetical protein
MMSEEKKPNRISAHYATDEDYKRMNFYTIGTLYRAQNSAPYACGESPTISRITHRDDNTPDLPLILRTRSTLQSAQRVSLN